MTPKFASSSPSIPIAFLQWTVGIVVLIASVQTFFHSAHRLASGGAHNVFLPLLSGAETLGAVLFLVPKTTRVGSFLLLVKFAIALIFHLTHGEWDIGFLIVYIAAVVVVRASSGSGVF
jgi:hypothetical protein